MPGVARLRSYVLISLFAQIVLSLLLLGVSFFNVEIIKSINHYTQLVSEQKLSFERVANTTRILNKAISQPNPNRRLVERVQLQIGLEAKKLRSIVNELDVAVAGDRGLGGFHIQASGDEYLRLKPKFDAFLKDLEAVSLTKFELMIFIRSYGHRLALAVDSSGAISTAIDQVVEDVVREGTFVSSVLTKMRVGIIVILVASVIYLGAFLILPSLQDLSHALRRERNVRKRMQHMANHDGMTGLLNREGLEREVEDIEPIATYAFAVIDLNMFKPINDTFGHAAGDEVLAEVARRLREAAGPSVAVARIGGDEFAALDRSAGSLEDCADLGQRLVSVFEKPVSALDRELVVGAAIGIALSTQTTGCHDAVATAADAAMYTLKGSGQTKYALYGAQLAANITNLSRKSELEEAIRNGDIGPYFQPKICLTSQCLVGFEALARWQHPTQGVVPPGDFLDDLTCFGLQVEFSMAMIEKVASCIRSWQSLGYNVPRVSVNLFADTLALDSVVHNLLEILTERKDVRHLIMLEITEDAFLPRIADKVKKTIDVLIKNRVRISIDDFGSGYASLRHLSEFQFHELKIDQSFVRGIGKDRAAEIIIASFVSIAEGLEVDVVAEGIQTQEQYTVLKHLGCDYGQGYLLGKPMSEADVAELLRFEAQSAG